MKKLLFNTNDSYAGLILRVSLGGVVLVHGAQKLLGWFGGYGFTGTMDFFTTTMHLPWLVALSVILLESVGAVALIAGLATRLLALAYTFLAVGILITHVQWGFFMNWFGNQGGEGIEYFLLWIGMAAALISTGSGTFSVDRLLFGSKESSSRSESTKELIHEEIGI
ncbi:DoxX family protein [Telluribacter sp. SYSU D00476]|uniref:DoxX family protein n=1 Tax=Telluribacter sp. SYSU D00476 TaxID=2811430 RepID=UPI001FF2082B|nr:DoxX family protein [Telluribacter sp. SYSU D00476]